MNWFRKFMAGRYGIDQLSIALLVLSIILAIVFAFFPYHLIRLIYIGLLVYTYFRIFSRNINQRYKENYAFLKFISPVRKKWNQILAQFKGRKTHKFYKCSFCSQMIRVPKGKGKIKITCPKCRNTMIRRT